MCGMYTPDLYDDTVEIKTSAQALEELTSKSILARCLSPRSIKKHLGETKKNDDDLLEALCGKKTIADKITIFTNMTMSDSKFEANLGQAFHANTSTLRDYLGTRLPLGTSSKCRTAIVMKTLGATLFSSSTNKSAKKVYKSQLVSIRFNLECLVSDVSLLEEIWRYVLTWIQSNPHTKIAMSNRYILSNYDFIVGFEAFKGLLHWLNEGKRSYDRP